jgi:hypothetical protein
LSFFDDCLSHLVLLLTERSKRFRGRRQSTTARGQLQSAA